MELAAAILLHRDGKPVAVNSLGNQVLGSEEWDRLRAELSQHTASEHGPVIFATGAASERAPRIIWVTPLTDCQTRQNGADLCIIFDLNRQTETCLAFLRTAFRFTRAEVRLAEQILLGRTPAEAAEVLGVSIHTVRTYLKRLYQKTETHSQATLVRKLVQAASLPVLIAA